MAPGLLLVGAIFWILAGILSQRVYPSVEERLHTVLFERAGLVVMLGAALWWIEEILRGKKRS